MLGIGGLVAAPFTQRYGRLPVLWWSMFMSLCMTLFATLAPNNTSFIVARCLMGLFTTAPQCIGLSLIRDMYFPSPSPPVFTLETAACGIRKVVSFLLPECLLPNWDLQENGG